MPTAQISLYLNDNMFEEYMKDKELYNAIGRDAIKSKIEEKIL